MPLKDGLNRNFSWYGKYKLLNKKHISISSIKKMSQCSSVDRECSICKAKNFSNNYKIENFLFLMLQRSNLDKPFPVLFISPHRIFWSVPSSPRRTHISWSPDKIISLKIKYTCLLLKNGASLSNEVSLSKSYSFLLTNLMQCSEATTLIIILRFNKPLKYLQMIPLCYN